MCLNHIWKKKIYLKEISAFTPDIDQNLIYVAHFYFNYCTNIKKLLNIK